jgi:succinoglycan biosynthesis transport protein ExoP
MEEDVKSIGDYLSIAWRRKFLILIPFIIVISVTVLTVFLLPPVYNSTGTILIESQQIPQELIQSTVTSFADERIQIIKQRIMTSQTLFDIIKKFNLYAKEIKKTARSEILDDMRSHIAIERVSANVKNQRRGASALIAFTVAFEHQSAAVAQKVANELVTLFLDENIKSRTARATETTEFLKKESDRLRSQIEAMEEQIATYKQENSGSLPENLRINLERVDELKVHLFNTEREVNELNEKKKLLLIEQDSIESGLKSTSKNNDQLSPEMDLRKMQNQFVSLSARYGVEHPDVKAIKRKIRAFEEEYGSLGDKEELQEQVEQVKGEIYELTQKYSSEHPDIKRLKRKLNGLEVMVAEYKDKPEVVVNEKNPEYLQVKARLESIDSSISSLKKSRLNLEQQVAQLDTHIDQTPQVERGLDALERDYDSTKAKYQEIRNKQSQAEMAMSLEEDQKGERFTLLEPPLFPDTPVKPNRPKVFLLGLILSIVSGIGVAGVAESLDGGIRGALALTMITKMRPLVTIPYITTQHDELAKKRNLKIFFVVLIVLGFTFVALVHFFYKPLDLIWFILLRNLSLT